MIDPRRIASLIVWSLQISVISGLGVLAILFLARVVMRRDWLAIIVTGLVMTALSLSQPNILVDFAMQAIAIAVGLFFLIRFGVTRLFGRAAGNDFVN